MSPNSPSGSARSIPVPAPPGPERDASNFDFRVVTLLLVLVTRGDLLKEYLDDGKQRDKYNVPLAVTDTTKWVHLRQLFDPDMLGQMLFLWERKETQEDAHDLRRVFQTMINLNEYDLTGCPNDDFVKAIVDYSHQQTAELDAAGIAVDVGSRN